MAYSSGAFAFAATAGSDVIIGTSGADTIDGGKGDDTIDGGLAADVVRGGEGDDTLIWNPGGGSDTVDGGKGFDTLQFNTANIGEVIGLSGANGHVTLTRDVASISMDVTDVERVSFGGPGGGADRFVIGDLSGTATTQVAIDLGAVADTLVDRIETTGAAGDDFVALATADGVTTVTGLTAALSITHAEAADRFVFAGGTGADTVDASAFAGGIGLDFQGGEGADALVIRGADKVANTIQLFGGQATPDGASIDVVVNGAAAHANLLDVETLAVSGGSEGDVINAAGLQAGQALTLDGGKGDDTLTSGQGADTVDGGAGDDLINSGRGADVLRGGAGDDTIVWNPGDGSDVVDGGAGVDTQAFNLANIGEVVSIIDMGGHAILTRNIAGIVMDLDNVERVAFGGPGGGADTFFFGSLAGTEVRQIDVDLGSVPDTLVDNVSASGEASADKIVVTGSAGDARVDGLAATLNVTHAEAIDRLVVSGFGGDDGIDATGFSGGMDLTLWGGGGSDTFTFGHSTGAQVQILDFTPHVLGFGDDVIELNGFAWNSFAEAVVTGHIAQAGADVVISDHDGVIVTLRNVALSDLTSGDFLFH